MLYKYNWITLDDNTQLDVISLLYIAKTASMTIKDQVSGRQHVNDRGLVTHYLFAPLQPMRSYVLGQCGRPNQRQTQGTCSCKRVPSKLLCL